jgi:hypothetical protein
VKLHASEITGSLSIKGTITPDGSGSHDLGSANNPWKDIHVMSSSIHVYDATGPIAKLGAIRGKGFEFKDHTGALARISGSALKVTSDAKIGGTATADEFVGGGAGITGVTAEWDGTHTGNGVITGNLEVTGNISGSAATTGSFGSIKVGPYSQIFSDPTQTSIGIGQTNGLSYALDNSNDLVIYNSSQVGLTLANHGGGAYIRFSDKADGGSEYAGTIAYNHSSDSFTFGTAGNTTALTLSSAQNATFAGNVTGTFVGNITGNVTGNTSGTAATVTTAAQPAITSVGTLTSFRSTGIDDNADALAITIDSSERVGIGTTDPGANLHIYEASVATPLQITRANNSSNGMIKFETGTTDDWIIGERNDSTSNFRIYSYGTSSDVFSILRASGNVGIGTTSP